MLTLTSRVRNTLQNVARIRSIGVVVQRPMRETLTQWGRLAAISCAKSTQPYGSGEAARDAGRNRVKADIYKVYATPGKAYADILNKKQAAAFWWCLKNGKPERALGILRKDGKSLRSVPFERFDGGLEHMKQRNARTGRVGTLRTPLAIITNPKQLETYVKKRQANVGFGKSAWSDLARQLGSIRGLKDAGDIGAGWITRNGGKGNIEWMGSKEAPLLRLTSLVRYSGLILTEPARREAIRIARERLGKSLEMAVRAETRKLRSS
jgi:hypothetical protein